MMLTNVPSALQIFGVFLLLLTIPCLWLAYRHRSHRLIPAGLRYLLLSLGALAPVGVFILSFNPQLGILLAAMGFPAFACGFSAIVFKDRLYEGSSSEVVAINEKTSFNTMSFHLGMPSIIGAGLLTMFWLTQDIISGNPPPGEMFFIGSLGLLLGGSLPVAALFAYSDLRRHRTW